MGAADDQVAEQHRRWSWWQVLLHPFAAYDDVVEDLRSADDNTYREIGYVVAVALNTALLLTKLGLPQSWKLLVGVSLLVISSLASMHFFTRRRRYQVFERVGSLPLHSPNLRTTVVSPQRSASGTVTFGNDIKAVKELNLWDPPALSQVLFCYFSPLQVIVILAADETSTTALIFALALAVSISLLITFMCSTFTVWKNDNSIIFKQAYDEQNRFMLSQTAKPKAEAAIQADSPNTIVVIPGTPTSAAKQAKISTAKKRRKVSNIFQQQG